MQEQAQKQAQEHEFLFHREKGLDTRTSEASTIGGRSNFSFLLHLLLLQHFLVKTEHEAEDQRVLLSCVFINHSCTRSGFVRGFTKMAEAEGCLKKGFQKQCVSSLFFSYDASVFIRYKELMLVSALVYHPRPHRSFVATSDFFWCQFFSFFVASTSI